VLLERADRHDQQSSRPGLDVGPERVGEDHSGIVPVSVGSHMGTMRRMDDEREELEAEELLVEDVSIDGMCGVY
jgi:mycofactocin precursor